MKKKEGVTTIEPEKIEKTAVHTEIKEPESKSQKVNGDDLLEELLGLNQADKKEIQEQAPSKFSMSTITGVDKPDVKTDDYPVFTLFPRDDNSKLMHVPQDSIFIKITSPKNNSITASIYSNGDGSYDLEWEPKSAGHYKIEVKVQSLPLKGSPFTLLVSKGSTETPEEEAKAEKVSADKPVDIKNENAEDKQQEKKEQPVETKELPPVAIQENNKEEKQGEKVVHDEEKIDAKPTDTLQKEPMHGEKKVHRDARDKRKEKPTGDSKQRLPGKREHPGPSSHGHKHKPKHPGSSSARKPRTHERKTKSKVEGSTRPKNDQYAIPQRPGVSTNHSHKRSGSHKHDHHRRKSAKVPATLSSLSQSSKRTGELPNYKEGKKSKSGTNLKSSTNLKAKSNVVDKPISHHRRTGST